MNAAIILRRLRRDRRGAATVEFAMWSVLFLAVMTVALDFGMYLTYKLRLGAAVEQGAIYAFNTRNAVAPTTIEGFVSTTAQLPNTVTATVRCNANQTCVNASRVCSCVSGSAPTFTNAASCGATCSSPSTTGATSGYYLRVVASTPYQSVVVPNAWLEGGTITEAATVRLQ